MRRELICFSVVLWSTSLFSMDTELRLYRPMTETTSHFSAETVDKKSGECFGQSHRIRREDAWYCVADGINYDPCFVERFGSHLNAVCIKSPWVQTGLQITVATPLDNHLHEILDMSQTYPWAIELTNGEKCQSTESSVLYDGLPVRYQCDRNTVLIGHVQRCSSTWKILQHGPQGVVTAEIARAWF